MEIITASLNPEQTYKLLTGVVVPRPIAWITSQSETGVVNVAPFSCYTIVAHRPAMIGVNIGRRIGVRKDTGKNIADSNEFVVNIASHDMLEPLHHSATEYEPAVSEVDLLGLRTLPSSAISVPRLADVPVSLECRLHSIIPFGESGSEFYVAEVLVAHVRDDLINDGKIETANLNPISRLAGPNYAHLGEIITLQPIKQTEKGLMPDAVAAEPVSSVK